MSKSIASQVRSMAKQMVDVQIYKCANQILVEMCNVFRDYMLIIIFLPYTMQRFCSF